MEHLNLIHKLRDSERIPLTEDIEEYFNREVEPHLPESWIDFEKSKVGYEINFTKYFYQYKPLRSSLDITNELLELEKESEKLLNQIVN
jgi:type I restriction enzyme M protein